jgi:hypothetical protein
MPVKGKVLKNIRLSERAIYGGIDIATRARQAIRTPRAQVVETHLAHDAVHRHVCANSER